MEVSDRARRSQWKTLSMEGALNEGCSQRKVLLMKDGFISTTSDRRFGSRVGSGLEPQCCFPPAISRFRQGKLGLNLPTPCFLRSPANQPVVCIGGARDFT